MLFRPEKWSFRKVQKIEILQKGESVSGAYTGSCPCILSKNRTFDHVWFFGKSIKKISFFYILYKKRRLFRPEKESLKKSKKSNFSMVFVEKSNFLSSMFFGKSSQTR